MKKIFLLLTFICSNLILCGYKFPEKLPAPLDIDTLIFERVKFGQTSSGEFAYLAPNYDKPEVQGIYTIYSETNLNNDYKFLRAGFKNQYLDWVELEFSVPQSYNKIIETYGKPSSVNEKHSNKFNYQDYGYFNIVTDKNNSVAFGITLYGESDYNPAIANVVNKLPDFKNFNFINIFIPGQLMENDFNAQFPRFLGTSTKDDISQRTYTVPAKYLKHNNLYSNVDFVFQNGILMFVNLVPKNLTLADVKKIYGQGTTSETNKKDKAFLEYPNFITTYDKVSNKVLNIGIIGAN